MLGQASENYRKITVVKKQKKNNSGYPKSDGVRSEKQWECKDLVFLVYGQRTTGSRSFSPEIPFPVNKKTLKGKAKIPTDTLRKPSGPIKLTSKLTVDSISTTTSLPSTWAVPRINSATLVDLSALDSLPRKPNGDEYSIDALIRAEVCLNASLHPYN